MGKEMSIPVSVKERELTPLERGLIGQVQRLMASVEALASSSKDEAKRQKTENGALLALLQEQEVRISALCEDIKRLEKQLSL